MTLMSLGRAGRAILRWSGHHDPLHHLIAAPSTAVSAACRKGVTTAIHGHSRSSRAGLRTSTIGTLLGLASPDKLWRWPGRIAEL
jgi:hypothetical protein